MYKKSKAQKCPSKSEFYKKIPFYGETYCRLDTYEMQMWFEQDCQARPGYFRQRRVKTDKDHSDPPDNVGAPCDSTHAGAIPDGVEDIWTDVSGFVRVSLSG